MIEINLLPGSGKKKASTTRRPSVDVKSLAAGLSGRFKDRVTLGSIAASVIFLGAIGWMWWSQRTKRIELEERYTAAKADSTRYASLFAERTRTEAVRDTVVRQVNLIRSIDQDRFVWPHIMDEVSQALPQYTWITLLATSGAPQGSTNLVTLPPPDTTTPKPGSKPRKPKRLDTTIPADVIQFKVMGMTVDIQALTRFYRQLEASPFITAVNLDRSEHATDQGKEVVQFTLTMTYERPDSTQIRRAPMVLREK